jgi:hypothetical protein
VNTFAHKKRHNKTLLVSSTFLKHARHFDYWNQSLNMRMLVFYLDFIIMNNCKCKKKKKCPGIAHPALPRLSWS